MGKLAKGSAIVIDRGEGERGARQQARRRGRPDARALHAADTAVPLAENVSRTLRYTPAGNVDFINSPRRQLTPPARAELVESLLPVTAWATPRPTRAPQAEPRADRHRHRRPAARCTRRSSRARRCWSRCNGSGPRCGGSSWRWRPTRARAPDSSCSPPSRRSCSPAAAPRPAQYFVANVCSSRPAVRGLLTRAAAAVATHGALRRWPDGRVPRCRYDGGVVAGSRHPR